MARRLYLQRFPEAGKDVYDKYQSNIRVNPSKQDIRKLLAEVPEGFLPVLRGILHNDLLIWSRPELLHEYVMEHRGMPRDSATLEFDFSSSPVEIRLSATNARMNAIGKLEHSKQADLVMGDPHVAAIFGAYDPQSGITKGATRATYV